MTTLERLILQFREAFGDNRQAGTSSAITAATQNGTYTADFIKRLIVSSINDILVRAYDKSAGDVNALAKIFPEYVKEKWYDATNVSNEIEVFLALDDDVQWAIAFAVMEKTTTGYKAYPGEIGKQRAIYGAMSDDSEYGRNPTGIQITTIAGDRQFHMVASKLASVLAHANTKFALTYLARQTPDLTIGTDDVKVSYVWEPKIISNAINILSTYRG